jgi:anti-anti-sigma regulatory factor
MFPSSNTSSGLRVTTFVASGHFSRRRCARLAETIEGLALQGWNRWVLDFGAVRHVDYRGLRRLLRAARVLEASGGAFTWCGLSPYLRDIARFSGGHDRPFFHGRHDALIGLVALTGPRAGHSLQFGVPPQGPAAG